MNRRTAFLAVALGAMSGALMAQQATSTRSATITTTTTTVTGSVVQYSPGQSIVVQGADGKTTTYTIGPSVQVPADVQIGRSVTLFTQPGKNGAPATVTSVEVKTANPADTSSGPSAWNGSASGATGQFSSSDVSSPPPMSGASGPSDQSSSSGQYSSGQSSTQSGSAGQSAGSGQSSDVPPSSGLSSGTSSSQTTQSETTQTTTTYSGKVTAYSPKQSITLDEPGKGAVTYVIDAQSDLPQDIAVGKTVTITTRTVAGSSKPVVGTVKTTTTTTKSTESHPQ